MTNNFALIAISDNGSGINDEAHEHLFEPNFTTKTSGMGLGLSIVQNIIQSFGGKIWYDTSPTKGTTFFVEIPRHQSTLNEIDNPPSSDVTGSII